MMLGGVQRLRYILAVGWLAAWERERSVWWRRLVRLGNGGADVE